MKLFHKIHTILSVLVILNSGCGDGIISDLKDFKPDKAPVITNFATDILSGTEILPNMEVNLYVEAHDQDNDEIEYSFSSDYGTFRSLAVTATGCTIQFFISSTCLSSASIPITVTASDNRSGTDERTIDIGDGRTAPGINSVSWPGSLSEDLSFTPDCSGYYQIRAVSSSVTSIDFDGSTYPCFFCDKEMPVSMTVYPGTGTDSETAAYLDLTADGTYNVFIVVYDNYQRQSAIYQTFTVDI